MTDKSAPAAGEAGTPSPARTFACHGQCPATKALGKYIHNCIGREGHSGDHWTLSAPFGAGLQWPADPKTVAGRGVPDARVPVVDWFSVKKAVLAGLTALTACRLRARHNGALVDAESYLVHARVLEAFVEQEDAQRAAVPDARVPPVAPNVDEDDQTETAEEWPHGRCSICGGFEPAGYLVHEGHLSNCAYVAPVVKVLRERMKDGHGLERLSPEALEHTLSVVPDAPLEPRWQGIVVDRDADLRVELRRYLDTLHIDGNTIGQIRRTCFVPWDSAWNGWVREDTAAREVPASQAVVDAALHAPQSADREAFRAGFHANFTSATAQARLMERKPYDWTFNEDHNADMEQQAWEAWRAAFPAALRAPREWQSIDSAPKDGTRLLLGAFHRTGVWLEHISNWEAEPNDGDPGWIWWCYPEQAPTHWQPLPAPPVIGAAADAASRRPRGQEEEKNKDNDVSR